MHPRWERRHTFIYQHWVTHALESLVHLWKVGLKKRERERERHNCPYDSSRDVSQASQLCQKLRIASLIFPLPATYSSNTVVPNLEIISHFFLSLPTELQSLSKSCCTTSNIYCCESIHFPLHPLLFVIQIHHHLSPGLLQQSHLPLLTIQNCLHNSQNDYLKI